MYGASGGYTDFIRFFSFLNVARGGKLGYTITERTARIRGRTFSKKAFSGKNGYKNPPDEPYNTKAEPGGAAVPRFGKRSGT